MENIKEELLDIKKLIIGQGILRKELLTVEEAAYYLGQTKSSIYKHTSAKRIPFYNPGGKKIYFKRSELDKWIFKCKIDSTTSMYDKVEKYLSNPPKS